MKRVDEKAPPTPHSGTEHKGESAKHADGLKARVKELEEARHRLQAEIADLREKRR